MDNPYYKKVNSKKSVMKALEEQRGRYAETFELWNAKQLELEQKRAEYRQLKEKERKINPEATRAPNKTDFYDKF